MLKLAVIGNLGNDPEVRYSQNGSAYLRCNVAGNYRTRGDGGWEDRTEWVRVTVFGQRVDSLSGLLKKGMKVYVEGRLEARPWTDQQGQVRAGLEVIANDVEFMSSRQQDGDAGPAASVADERRRPMEDRDGGLEDLPF